MEEKMRMRSLYRKPTTLRCNAGSRCYSTSAVIWSLLGCLLLFHLYSNIHHKHEEGREVQLRVTNHPQFRDLQQVEEEIIQLPQPKGKRSPRAAKRKHKRVTPLVDEFLDEGSRLRHVFFPGNKSAIDPIKVTGNDSYYYYPGRSWLDTDGNPIQAHGGGILYDERSRTYYWYGEYKDGPTYHAHKRAAARVDIIGVGCYSSKDLWTWKHEGIVLAAEETNGTHDLYKSNVLERPKVIYNEKTRKYVMWMHIDDANYTKAAVGIAISDTPDGPFEYLGSQRPHGYESRDMTVFKDEDGVAYLIYSSEENNVLHIGPLTEDYLNVIPVMRRVFVGQRREAPAVFKHQGTYYMITSGCTGWAPNEALAHAAESILGPWETMGNPCVGGNKMFRIATFLAQSTFVLPLPGFPGSFIFMADRWNPADLRDSRYVWLPLIVEGPADQVPEYSSGLPLWSRVSIYWHRKWRLPQGWSTFQ
ncbi:hydrolase protein [Spatholobus suberectus]|nr:hydrolase protein [Spatholobus suberectus]